MDSDLTVYIVRGIIFAMPVLLGAMAWLLKRFIATVDHLTDKVTELDKQLAVSNNTVSLNHQSNTQALNNLSTSIDKLTEKVNGK